MTDELTRLQTWNASLRENITHIAGQLVERTAECAELRKDRDRCQRNAELWRTAAEFAGRHPLIAFLAGIALASLVAGVW